MSGQRKIISERRLLRGPHFQLPTLGAFESYVRLLHGLKSMEGPISTPRDYRVRALENAIAESAIAVLKQSRLAGAGMKRRRREHDALCEVLLELQRANGRPGHRPPL